MILALALLMLGVAVLSYPALSDYVNRRNGSSAIQTLSAALEQTAPERLAEERRRAEQYNAACSASGEGVPEEYESIMDFGNGVMGYLSIPKIGVTLPIYHGVSEQVLRKGVGHLPRSALPIGGAGNHAVLSGHTGLPTAELLTELTELEPGDRFSVSVLEETLVYQVDQVKVVLPAEVEDLAPVAGEDLCTLVTCTPYGVNSHRLLVRGVRVPGEAQAEAAAAAVTRPQVPVLLLAAAVAELGALTAFVVLLVRRRRG